ncbi:hypothetical protein M2T28_08080 [Elizabethkingia miricola]|uniref:hypothetical protein n=1 Tax=Elizabethkingia TaxID=308865 RepID=UPI0015C4DEBA|nr:MULTISPECIES: hypothetical protein [Elizabethkingia]MCL1652566.1 hypothetical protein [Elizabethkingia miricola]
MYETFEEWWDAFVEFVRGMGYNGFIDSDSFQEDYELGAEPREAAEIFVKEMND